LVRKLTPQGPDLQDQAAFFRRSRRHVNQSLGREGLFDEVVGAQTTSRPTKSPA
jgi:hypothetical protein